MEDNQLSVSSISNQKLQEVQQQAQVSVAKKAQDQNAAVVNTLIQSATSNQPAPGVGTKLNTVA